MAKEKLDSRLELRISSKLKNKSQARADLYAGGNLNKWIRHCLEFYHPKFLKGAVKPPKD